MLGPEQKSGSAHPEAIRRVRIELSGRTLAMLVATAAALWLSYRLWPVLVILAAALLLVGLLQPFAIWLESAGFRRHWALLTVFATIVGSVSLLLWLTVPGLIGEVSDMLANAPVLQAKLAHALEQNWLTAPLAMRVRTMSVDDIATVAGGLLFAHTTHLFVLIGSLITTVFLALYLIAERETAQAALYAMMPRRYHMRVARILLNLGDIVGGYLRGQIFTSLLMAVFTIGLLYSFGVPNAIGLGVLAAIFDVLPFIGGLLAITPVFLSALSVSTPTALAVLTIMVAYQEFESRILVPKVYGRTMRLPASAIILAILAGGVLMGIPGALIALPVAAGLRMIVKELRLELPGDDAPHGELDARDARIEEAYEVASAGAPPADAARIAHALADVAHREDARAQGTDEAAAEVALGPVPD